VSRKTLEELQSDLADAELALEQVDTAIAALSPKADKRDREELEAQFTEKENELRNIADDIDRKERMAKAVADRPKPTSSGVEVVSEPRTYERGRREADGTWRSFFRDALNAEKGDYGAQTRIARHQREMAAAEQRAFSTASGSGVGLVPPQYLQEELAEFARASRPFADALGGRPLPDTGMTFNVPRVTTGTTTAVQSAEAAAVQDNTPVTDTIAMAVNTVAGKVDASQQVVDRSDPATDTVIGQDLAADYAKQLDNQLLNQATNGIVVLSGINAITYTSGSPTVPLLYAKIADGVQQIWTNRFAAPDLIVMAPRRWGSFLASLDTSNRPLIVPDATQGVQIFNALGTGTNRAPQGIVGVVQGLPVLVDAQIPTNQGTNTNQDVVLITKRSDHLLFETGAPTIRVMSEVLSGTLQVRILAYGYFAFTFNRYAKATSVITGTGLTPPAF